MADTYLTWWTSIETDLRKSLVINAMRDHGAMHSLIRTAFEAGQSSATSPSPSTAPEVGERAAFEAKYRGMLDLMPCAENDSYMAYSTYCAWRAWKDRGAALASRPAEVDEARKPPRTPEEIIAFVGSHFDAMRDETSDPEDIRFTRRCTTCCRP